MSEIELKRHRGLCAAYEVGWHKGSLTDIQLEALACWLDRDWFAMTAAERKAVNDMPAPDFSGVFFVDLPAMSGVPPRMRVN